MKSRLNQLSALMSALMAIGMTFGCAPVLRVKSDPPDAEVYLINSKTAQKKLLGKSPLEITVSELKEKLDEPIKNGDFFEVSVEKAKYNPEKLMIPSSRTGLMVTSLDVVLKQGNTEKEIHTAKDALDHIFLAQRLAMSGEHERAQIELDQVLVAFPDFPRALTMRASIYYIEKNYGESLKWYERALAVEPNLDDVLKMIKKIKDHEFEKVGKK